MLKIELYNPELDKVETFTEGFVSARALRRVIEFGVKQETEVMNELEQLDELVALVASLFRSEKSISTLSMMVLPPTKLPKFYLESSKTYWVEKLKKEGTDGTSESDGIKSYQDYLDNLDQIYKDLIEAGWSYKDIEEMDINGFLRLMGDKKKKTKTDDIEEFFKSI